MDLNDYAYNELYISDLHKDARGFRPRIDFNNGQWTKESIDKFYDGLLVKLEERIEEDARHEAEALEAFETHIAKMMADHNISRETAIRWDVQAEAEEILCKQDAEFYLYKKGIGFKDMAKFVPVVMEIAA